MLQLKDLWGRSVGEEVTTCDGKILEEFRRTTWPIEALGKRASIVSGHPPFRQGPEFATAKGCGGRRRKEKKERRSAQRGRGLHGECGLGLANTGEDSTA